MLLTFPNARKVLKKVLFWIGLPSIVAMLIALLTFDVNVIEITGLLVVSLLAIYAIFVALYFVYMLLFFVLKLLVPTAILAAILAAVLLAIAMFLPGILGGPVYSLEELVSPIVEKVFALI